MDNLLCTLPARKVLVEREKPAREALRAIYNETHTLSDELEMFLLSVEECDCALSRAEMLQTQTVKMQHFKESIAPLLKLISEREGFLQKVMLHCPIEFQI